MAPLVPFAKLFGVFARQLAKPVSSRLEEHARRNPLTRRWCVHVGQSLNWLSVRILRLSANLDAEYEVMCVVPRYPEDWEPSADAAGTSAAAPRRIDPETLSKGRKVELVRERQIPAATPAPGEEESNTSSQAAAVMQLVEWSGKDGEKHRGWIPKLSSGNQETLRRIGMTVKRLPDGVAVERGSQALGQAFIFGVAVIVVAHEAWRKSQSDAQEAARKSEARRLKRVAQAEDAAAARAELRAALHAEWTAHAEELRAEVADLRLAYERLASEVRGAQLRRD